MNVDLFGANYFAFDLKSVDWINIYPLRHGTNPELTLCSKPESRIYRCEYKLASKLVLKHR